VHAGKLQVRVYPRVGSCRVEIFGAGRVRVSKSATGTGRVAEMVDPHTSNVILIELSKSHRTAQQFIALPQNDLRTAYDRTDFGSSSARESGSLATAWTAALPVSIAECEHGFSRMNLICTPLSSMLTVKHLSSLMFMSLVGMLKHFHTAMRSRLRAFFMRIAHVYTHGMTTSR